VTWPEEIHYLDVYRPASARDYGAGYLFANLYPPMGDEGDGIKRAFERATESVRAFNRTLRRPSRGMRRHTRCVKAEKRRRG
jgi:hypothetical protein